MICKGLTVVVLSFYEPSLVSLVCTGRYHQHVSWAQRGVAGPMVCGNGGCHLLCHQSCFIWGRNWVIRSSCTSVIASEVGFPRMTGPPLEIWHEFFPDFHPDLGQSWIILCVWNHQTTNFNQHTEFFLRSLPGHWLVTALLQSSLQVGVGLQGPSFDSKSREALDGYRASCCSDLSDCAVLRWEQGLGVWIWMLQGIVSCFIKWGEQFAMLLYCYTAKLTALYCYTRRWEFLSWFLDVAPLASLFQCWLGDLAPPGAIQTPACRCSAWNSGGQSQVLGRLR